MEEKVVGCVRVSTEGQVRDGYSLAYQVEEMNVTVWKTTYNCFMYMKIED